MKRTVAVYVKTPQGDITEKKYADNPNAALVNPEFPNLQESVNRCFKFDNEEDAIGALSLASNLHPEYDFTVRPCSPLPYFCVVGLCEREESDY